MYLLPYDELSSKPCLSLRQRSQHARKLSYPPPRTPISIPAPHRTNRPPTSATPVPTRLRPINDEDLTRGIAAHKKPLLSIEEHVNRTEASIGAAVKIRITDDVNSSSFRRWRLRRHARGRIDNHFADAVAVGWAAVPVGGRLAWVRFTCRDGRRIQNVPRAVEGDRKSTRLNSSHWE